MPESGAAGVSVIIPVLNEAGCLDACLASLAPLREQGAEVILVDGGSSDGSPELAQAHGVTVLESPAGRALQMNAGAAAASGSLLFFLHADTRITSAAANALAGLSWHHGWGRMALYFDHGDRRYRFLAWTIRLRSELTGVATGDQGLFVSRELFQEVGGFPEIPLMEDVALSKRLRRLAPPVCLHARVLTSARRWEERGYLRTVLLMYGLRFLYWIGVSPQRLAEMYR